VEVLHTADIDGQVIKGDKGNGRTKDHEAGQQRKIPQLQQKYSNGWSLVINHNSCHNTTVRGTSYNAMSKNKEVNFRKT
jgi:hypothetical protein